VQLVILILLFQQNVFYPALKGKKSVHDCSEDLAWGKPLYMALCSAGGSNSHLLFHPARIPLRAKKTALSLYLPPVKSRIESAGAFQSQSRL